MLPVQQFVDFIQQKKLFLSSDQILLAVSGGKDSALMVKLFHAANFHFAIAHCNFNLRGEEADRDENFVRNLAEQLQVPCHIVQFDTRQYAESHKLSIQMAARELRYQWFEQLSNENNYNYVAVAQHQNDAVETILLNLVRGTGISGLHGISSKRDRVIRPLLFLNRQEINQIIEQERIPFVEDSSNRSDKYARNNIRLNVVPVLRKINPNLEQTFVKNMERFTEIEQLLAAIVAEKRAAIVRREGVHLYIAKDEIRKLNPRKLLLFELLRPYGFTDPLINEILNSLNSQSGISFYSANFQLSIDRGRIIISPINSVNPKEIKLFSEGDFMLENEQRFRLSISAEIHYENNSEKAFVDFDKLIFPLTIRYRQHGDKFIPLGMKKFKKLSDFLVDSKVPYALKSQVPILCNANGEIIWVIGMRTDERYKLTENSKKVAIFERL